MMRNRILNSIFVFILLLFFPSSAVSKICVVATTEDLASIAREIGGDKADVTALAKGYQDPHFVDAKPSLMIRLMKADLFIQVGLELEVGWAPSLIQSSGNKKIQAGAQGFLDASARIPLLEVSKGPVSRAEGDVHPFGNPHYWLDPANGLFIADTITEKLSSLDPSDSSYFKSRNENFKKRLNDAIKRWTEQAKSIGLTGSKVVTYHKSWSYFVERFGLNVINFVEPRPGVPPPPQHVQSLIAQMKSEQAKLIIIEPFYDIKLPQKISSDTGAKLVVLPTSVGAEKSILTYFDLFDRQFNLLSDALKGGN